MSEGEISKCSGEHALDPGIDMLCMYVLYIHSMCIAT